VLFCNKVVASQQGIVLDVFSELVAAVASIVGGGRLPWLAWSGYFSVTDNERTTWQIALRWCGDGISE
jgi:hypothetical protein